MRSLETLRRTPRASRRQAPEFPTTAGISVVVAYHPGDNLEACLDSLVEQTLSRDCFEVIIVVDGHAGDHDPLLARVEQRAPGLRLRVVEVPHSAAFRFRELGIHAARREHTAFLDANDRVAPVCLQNLLEAADEGTITVARMINFGGNGTPPADDTEIPRIDEEATDHEFRFTSGKLVPTALAKQVERDFAPESPTTFVFFLALLVRHHCVVRQAGGVVCYRAASHVDDHEVRHHTFDESVVARMKIVAQLDSLAAKSDDTTLPLLRGHVDVQADAINTYLRDNPEQHERVAEVIDTYDLRYFPNHRLNRGLAKALAIAYCFAPYNDSSAVVMAKRVRERHDVVDVVYNAMDKNRDKDPSMRRICAPYVENEIAIDSPTYFSNWAAIEAFRVTGMMKITDLERTKGPYARMYSRAMWPASHFLAAAYKLHNPSVIWAAEFSDPAARDVTGAERSAPIGASTFLDDVRVELQRRGLPVLESENSLVWCEYLAYAFADVLVFTNQNQLDYMLGYCPVPEVAELARDKALISPHPTLTPAFYSMVEESYPLDPTVANLAYFGTFYATRGLDDVLMALAALDQETRERIRLHVFTSRPDDLREHVDRLGVSELVRINAYVRFLAFLNLSTKFDCLIVNDALTAESHARNPYLPSKWSDYHGSGRPVWGLVEEGSPMSTRPLAFVSPVGDVAAAQDVLRKIAAEPRN
ncbi:glycosyltransferase [Actinopolymorpha alba]|uniref:glycosyltransferase n=1 Tax=Actinopolymorpha alba TaxID=533267 RepID=UPI0012F6D771|nr:glycosyltransferase [Actinopolymorpha alba]